ncbi:MAG: ComEC family competence protein [Clostridiales bacterium]|nr:ComEC family competence protein [Clostridiales bacterium]
MLGIFIFTTKILKNDYSKILLILFVSFSLILCLVTYKISFKMFLFINLLFLAFSFGFYKMYYVDELKDLDFLNFENKYVWIVGKIIEIPKLTNAKEKYEYTINVYEVSYNDIKYFVNNKIILYTPANQKEFYYGDFIKCFTKLTKPAQENFSNGFSHRNYLKQKSVYLLSFCDKVEKLNYKNKIPNIVKIGLNVRKKIIDISEKAFNNNQLSAIVEGILIGEQSKVNQNFREKILKSGMIHLITFSGIKISIFLFISNFFINKFCLNNKFINILNLFIVLVIGVVCKNTPAVKYAILINIVHIASFFFKREPDRLNTLFVCAGILLIYNPFILQNIGFIFSFCSSLSIVIFKEKIKAKLMILQKIPKIGNFLSDALAMNFSVILGTLYFTVYFFNVFPIFAIVSNLFITFIIYYVFIIGILMLTFSCHCSYFSKILSFFISFPIKIINYFINEFSHFKAFSLELPKPNKSLFFAYLFALFMFYRFLSKEKSLEEEN